MNSTLCSNSSPFINFTSFDNFQAKSSFMARAGYPDDVKFIKGEEFEQRVEFID